MHRGPALTPAEHALANRPESPFAVRRPSAAATAGTAPTTPSSTTTTATPAATSLPQRSRLFSPPPLHPPRFDFLAATARLGGALAPSMDLVSSRPRAGSAPSVAALANPFMPAAPRARAWPAAAAPTPMTVADDPPTPPHPPANPNLAAPRGILRRAPVDAAAITPRALGTSAPAVSLRKVASTPHLPRADTTDAMDEIDDDYGPPAASATACARSRSRSRGPPPPASAVTPTPTPSGTSSARRRIRRDIDALLARHHRSNPDLRGAALAEQAAMGEDGDECEPHRAVPEPPALMAHPVPLTLTRNQNRGTPSPPPPPAVYARVPSRTEMARAPSRGPLGDGMHDMPPRAPSRADLRTPIAAAPIPRAPSRGDLPVYPHAPKLRMPMDPAPIARVPSRAEGVLAAAVLPQAHAVRSVQRTGRCWLKLLHYEAAALSSSETSLVQQKADLAAQVLQLQQRVRDLERDKLALQSQLAAITTTATKDPLRTPTAPTFFDRPITPATTVRRGSESSTASSLRAPSPTPRTRPPTGPSSSALPTPTPRTDSSVVFSEWDDADVTFLSNVALDLVSDRVVKVPRHAAAVVPEAVPAAQEDVLVDRTPARASMVLPDITSPSLFRPLFADLGGPGGVVPVVAEEDEELETKATAPHRESGWSDVVITGFDEDASVCSRDEDADRRRHEQEDEGEEDHARPLHRLAQVNGSQIWMGAGAAGVEVGETVTSPSA
ncbi:hypothetical protein AMAG_07541 [Allomyces macrogynus ATCC 38327]|uniref:Uncharacterized protein n=1 Tax=Allomyces macrogynus (strain ATCC 38327) TaxID=578462 RepID=A0A0L0SIN3_ALLM3|nr:hypothetical protein AMAG_07541 [Allomyces macrogynus ATCC 38327]|eukprot:KNE62309.1 hypothetical protein AMAG_07541 [Allomyces macrogynus ATCC 38327]